ncbi:hypothetical protein [Pantoea agglomerans]|nr:hypothetical protein [Pantoea agglomerans]
MQALAQALRPVQALALALAQVLPPEQASVLAQVLPPEQASVLAQA